MRELEIKFSIEGPVEDLMKSLTAMELKFGQWVRQKDTVFARARNDIISPQAGTVVARVREDSADGSSVTVKIRREADLDREEEETSIEDPATMRRILAILGLKELVVVSKSRATASVTSSAKVLVDVVDKLGLFVEIEILGEEASAQQHLDAIRNKLAPVIPLNAPAVTSGYDRLLLEDLAGAET
jgi:predicted adenylyl cyclase CyaB